jgi:hypothetical protein
VQLWNNPSLTNNNNEPSLTNKSINLSLTNNPSLTYIYPSLTTNPILSLKVCECMQLRGLQLLAPGARLVYSTCSLNVGQLHISTISFLWFKLPLLVFCF